MKVSFGSISFWDVEISKDITDIGNSSDAYRHVSTQLGLLASRLQAYHCASHLKSECVALYSWQRFFSFTSPRISPLLCSRILSVLPLHTHTHTELAPLRKVQCSFCCPMCLYVCLSLLGFLKVIVFKESFWLCYAEIWLRKIVLIRKIISKHGPYIYGSQNDFQKPSSVCTRIFLTHAHTDVDRFWHQKLRPLPSQCMSTTHTHRHIHINIH